MPTYDYKCRDCTATASISTSIDKQVSIPICAKCQAEMVRDFGFQSVQFKGNGFYTTDKGKK